MKKLFLSLAALSAVASPLATMAETSPETWVVTDELNRPVANADDPNGARGTFDPDVQIGMFYYIWHHTENTMKDNYDVTDILNRSTTNPYWGPERTYHYGSKPWLGYYEAGDKDVMYRHLQMLTDAGVDFLVFDCTNGLTYVDRIQKMIEVIRQREKAGLRNPKLTCMAYNNQIVAIKDLWNGLYSKSEYADLWYQWNGKPLLLCNVTEAKKDASVADILSHFTLRTSWAWQGGKQDTWSWLDSYPQKVGYTMVNGKKVPECISVGAAQHPTTNIGRSYHNGKQPAIDAKGLCAETPQGLYFAEQWKRAHSLSDSERPDVVLITQWNEHIAMRFRTGDATGADPGKVRPGGKKGDQNESYFVDVYNAEYNRDLEPSTHPLTRDNYYLQMVDNIRKYRGIKEEMPEPTHNIIIDMNGAFTQWEYEPQEFLDDKGDHAFINTAHDLGGRKSYNDITRCKVTQDNDNLYFFVEAAAMFKWDKTSTRNMRLLLNTTLKYNDGYYGYNFMLERDPNTKVYTLKKNKTPNKFEWENVPGVTIPSKEAIRQIMVAVPKSALGKAGNFDVDFKWVDNVNFDTDEGDPLLFYSEGDCAPNNRFNYRYKGSKCDETPATANDLSGIYEVVADASACAPVTVSPNPTSGDLHIASEQPIDRIDIFALDGRLVGSMEDPDEMINISDLANGRYLLHFAPCNATIQVIKR